jgi:predicted nuclease with TOPRIM domain
MRRDGDFTHFLEQECDEVRAELHRLEAERARLAERIGVLHDEVREAEALLAGEPTHGEA